MQVSVFNKFFPDCRYMHLAAKIQPDRFVRWCQNGDFLRPVFAASRVPHISDLHSKFALCVESIVDIQSPAAEIRRGKKIEG